MKVKNAWLCQIKNRSVLPVFCDFEIEDGRISKIEKRDFNEFCDIEYDIIDSEYYDVRGSVLTIPNINFHDHIYSRLAKGLPFDGLMDNFQNILKNLWWQLDLALDSDMIVSSAHMAAYESVVNGVQYIFDHHSSPNVAIGSLELIKSVFSEYGLKGVLCFETTDRNGEILKENALLENNTFLVDQTDEHFKGIYGIHASFTVNDETLKKISEYVNESDIGIHIHLSEDESDNTVSVNKYGARPLQRLIKNNLVNEKTIISHGVNLNEDDIKLLKECSCAIAFNPDSNMNNSVGLPCIDKMPDNISFLLGTDGMHANTARSFKQIFLLLRNAGLSFDATFNRMQKIYFDQIEFIKKYYSNFSELTENESADFIVWDYVPPTPLTEKNFFGHYIYGIIERNVKASFSRGELLMSHGKPRVSDIELISKQIYKSGRRLYSLLENK